MRAVSSASAMLAFIVIVRGRFGGVDEQWSSDRIEGEYGRFGGDWAGMRGRPDDVA